MRGMLEALQHLRPYFANVRCMRGSCSLRDNLAIGSATEAALGGAFFFDGSGAASIERSDIVANSVMGPDAQGGCFGIRDGGVLYVRDSVVANNSAAYGAVLRIHSHRSGDKAMGGFVAMPLCFVGRVCGWAERGREGGREGEREAGPDGCICVSLCLVVPTCGCA